MYNEIEVIRRCQKGEASAQELLYKHYASRMRYVCVRYARTNFDVDDIFQDAFIKLFANIHLYKGEGSFDGWVRRIFVNTAIDHYRKQSKWRDEQPLEETDYEQADACLSDEYFEQLASRLSSDELLEMVNSLPTGYRLVFNLYAIEKYTHAQIAEQLGVTEGTSKSQLSKARKMLKLILKNYLNSKVEMRIVDEQDDDEKAFNLA